MKVKMLGTAYDKMRAYIDLCEYEISGMGKVSLEGDEFTVHDVIILAQEVNGASSDIDTDALARMQVELIQAGENPAEWSLWWHSHAKMSVFWSGKDMNTINASTEFPYLLSIVANHAEDILARIDVFSPVRLSADNLDVEIVRETDSALEDACRADIAAKVRMPKPIQYGAVGFHSSVTNKWHDMITPSARASSLFDDEYHERLAGEYYVGQSDADKKEEAKADAIMLAEWYDERDDALDNFIEAKSTHDSDMLEVSIDVLGDIIARGKKMGVNNEAIADIRETLKHYKVSSKKI
jgi:proteasome lid subunit RPN8/RPN11